MSINLCNLPDEPFNILADNITELVWFSDTHGKPFWCNRKVYKFTGTTAEELTNKGLSLITHPDYTRGRVNTSKGKNRMDNRPERNGFSELTNRYIEKLLGGNRDEAIKLILDSTEHGISVQDLYLEVLQPAQHIIGDLWHIGKISVAREHYCSYSTQLIMSMLYQQIKASPKKNQRLIATCVEGEMHDIGIRMVADFFEIEGWYVYYLGANTPSESIITTVEDIKPQILALSVSMAFNITTASQLIQKIRESDIDPTLNIIVGGTAFNQTPNLWKTVKADGFAHNAKEAVAVTNSIL